MLSDTAMNNPERHKYINEIDMHLRNVKLICLELSEEYSINLLGRYRQKTEDPDFVKFENLVLVGRPQIRERVHAILRNGSFKSAKGRSKVETIVCSESKKIVADVRLNGITFRRYNSNEFTRNAENKICHHNGTQNVRDGKKYTFEIYIEIDVIDYIRNAVPAEKLTLNVEPCDTIKNVKDKIEVN